MRIIRKYIRKIPSLFSANELKVFFTIASKKEGGLLTKTAIAKASCLPVSTTNDITTRFKEWGLINPQFDFTDKGKKVLRYFNQWDKTFERKLRVHDVQVVLFLSGVSDGFDGLRGVVFSPFTNNRYRGLKAELVGCKVLFYSQKKAVAVLPELYGDSDDEVAGAAVSVVGDLVRVLESEFGVGVSDFKIARYSCMHVAVLDSVIAEQFILRTGRICQGRVTADKSHGRYELEATGERALEDVEVLVKYEDLARENDVLKKRIAEMESQHGIFRKEGC